MRSIIRLARRFFLAVCFLLIFGPPSALGQNSGAQLKRNFPDQIPPKRTSQIQDGFGINSDLPREPYLPWNRWWWTRMFDAGVKWIRIGQYENSSEPTSWDWVEQKRGVYSISPEVDDYVDSLVENGVKIQVQLLYGNPMYTSPAGKLPDSITPEPGSFHNDDRSLYSVFWPPRTPQQIEAFTTYTKWVVNHFRGRIKYYALWNEQDIGYWNPWGNPEDYGRLLAAFVPAVHQTDPDAKVIYGGQADPSRDFTKRALDTCKCAAGIDIYAYHTYPGYGHNLNPETMDYGAYGDESPAKLREFVRHYTGIRADIEFWDDEFNSIGTWTGSDESVQAKYIPRGMVYNWAAGVKTFVWLLAAGTDGNEYDDFGIIHGLRFQPDDFTPRPVYYALQNTNAVFSDTHFDPSIEIASPEMKSFSEAMGDPFFAYGFRAKNGKGVVAYWLAAHSVPENIFPPLYGSLSLKNTGIEHPVLIDIVSGKISALDWKNGVEGELANVPLRDSVMAVADQSYFDWPVFPEAPSSLDAKAGGNSVMLKWELHGGGPTESIVERRNANGSWMQVKTLPAPSDSWKDPDAPGGELSYRVRAANKAGQTAFSNIVRVKVEKP
jgi:hypothetical protein